MATTTGIGVSQTIAIDLAKPGIPKMVYAMQGEGYTRTVSLKIFDGGVQWTPPNGAVYEVSYCKPDGKGGTYSSYTTDSSKPAVTVSDGRLNVVLIPQMLQVAGRVRVEVHMQHAAIMAYAERLSTFTFYIMVQASAESGITSVDYWESDKTDKVVMLTTEIGATANVATTHNVSEFVATPRVGDAVVGSDGYVGKVTAASGTSVTIVSTGALWADLSGTGNAVPLPTYNMPEVGSVVQVKELDASGNPKSWRYSKMASVCFTNEADIPTTPGTAVQLVGLAWYPDDPKLGELAVGKNGYTGEVTAVDDENGPTVTATGNRIFTFAASDITYSGTVDGQAVANVNAALDALNAKKDVAVFSATLYGKTLSSAATFPEISAAYSAGKQVLLKVDTSGGIYWLLPLVRFLGGMVASFAAWVSDSRLAVATLSYSATSTPPVNAWSLTQVPLSAESVAYSGKVGSDTVANVKAALDGLAIGKPLDMTADYVASGAEDPLGWAAMAKVVNGTASTTEYRVAPGRYYIGRENMQNGWIVDIIDFHAAPFRAIIAIGGGDEPCPRFMATVTDTVGSSNVSIAGISVYGDDIGCVTWYGDNYRLVPEPTNNDEGKFLKCTGYGMMEWASLPTYDGGVS